MKNIIEKIIIHLFCERKKLNLMKLEIIVIRLEIIGELLIVNVILMLHRNRVIFFSFPFHKFSNSDCHLFLKS